MPWNVLIFPLLGGFICLDWCFLSRLRNQRIDGNRLLLEAAFTGVALAMFSYAGVRFCEVFQIGVRVSGWWSNIRPTDIPYLGTALLALALGPCIAFLINGLLDRDFAKRKAIQKVGDYVLGLLYEAASQFELIQVVLDSNKVYVALVSIAPDLKPENHVVLLPIIEGSRDKDTLEIHYREKQSKWTYAWPSEERRWAEVIVPLSSIRTVNRVKSLRDLR